MSKGIDAPAGAETAPVVLLVPEVGGAELGPLAGALVLTPNPRAAAAAGVGPRSLEGEARLRLRGLGLQPASVLARWRALRWAVGDTLSGDDIDGGARSLAPTVREVLRAGLDVGPGRRGAPEPGAGSEAVPTDRLERVLAVARAYRERLLGRGLVDPAEALWLAARAGSSGAAAGAVDAEAAADGASRRRLRVLGYPRIGPAEVAFLAAVAAPGSVLALPCGRDPVFDDNRRVAEALAQRGWRVIDASPERPPPDSAPPATLSTALPSAGVDRRGLRFPSRDSEVRNVLTDVKRLLASGASPESIVLVARDDASYGPLVRDVAWEYELPVATSYTVPLRDTRVGAWTAGLLEAVRRGLPFEATVRLLAHPLGGGLAPAAWDRARLTHPQGVEAWRALDPRIEALDWPERAARGELLARLRACWAAFGLSAAARPGQDPLAGPAGGAAGGAAGALAPDAPLLPADTLPPADALAFQRLAAAALGLGLPEHQPVSRGAFLHDLDALLALASVPASGSLPAEQAPLGGPDGDPGGTGAHPRRVELHTPLAVYGARYRHVFVLGAAEGTLPKPVADDPVLDFAERRDAAARGLPLEGAVEAARREALSFRAVLWTLDGDPPGASLTLSYSEDVGIASPYFAMLGLVPIAPGPKPPASVEELRRRNILRPGAAGGEADPVLAAARRAWAVERRREEAGGPDAHDGLVGEAYELGEHVFSATQLLDLGQCPFRWLARVPFNLAEPEEAEDDVSPLLRGRLYHEALERALRRGRDAAGDGASGRAVRAAALDALGAAFAEAEDVVNAAAVPAWPLRRGQHLEQLRRVLSAESFLPDGAEVVALEQRFPVGGEAPPSWRGFPVRGIVDRVDRRSGGLVLVDYKTASRRPAGAQDEKGKARLDLQLPLYLEAAAPALFEDERVAGAQYYSLTTADVISEVRVDQALAGELDAFASRARALLGAGAYPVAPDLDFEACRTCDFDLVCRKGPRTERMRSRGAFAAPVQAAAPGRSDEGER